MAIYTLEIEADTGSGIVTFYAASGAFNTGPDDVPAHQHFHPSLQTPANFERALFSSGTTTGASSIGFGDIVLVNAHGRYDAWADYAFDGRPCIIKAIPVDDLTKKPLWAYKDAPVLIRGTVDSLDVTDAYRTIKLRLYDRLSDLAKPLLTETYPGTVVAGKIVGGVVQAGGADGPASLKDQIKPAVYGVQGAVPPVDVNPFDLVRQVSHRACAVITVFDGGVALTAAGDFATVEALIGATIAAGSFGTCLALGLFRLGGSPAATVTADVTGAGGTSAAGIAQAIIQDAGFGAADLDEASFAALAALNPAPCGILVTGDRTVLDAATDVLRSVGGWIVSDSEGRFQVGRLELPATTPIAVFLEWQLRGDVQRVAPGDSNRGIPAYQVTVRYGQLATVLAETDIAGVVEGDQRTALQTEWRSAVVTLPAVQTRHLRAETLSFDTRLVNATDAQAEAQRLAGIYGTRRDVWRVNVDMAGIDYRVDSSVGQAQALPIDLGATVNLSLVRFIAPSKNLVVIGRVEDCVNDRIQFDLWG